MLYHKMYLRNRTKLGKIEKKRKEKLLRFKKYILLKLDKKYPDLFSHNSHSSVFIGYEIGFCCKPVIPQLAFETSIRKNFKFIASTCNKDIFLINRYSRESKREVIKRYGLRNCACMLSLQDKNNLYVVIKHKEKK